MMSMPAVAAQTDHRLGFETLDAETTIGELELEGSLPEWLSGSLVRTGPAKFEIGASGYRHWFDGLAMLHRFAFAGGNISYANRYLESRAYRAARDGGRIAYAEFATDPCRTLFRRVASLFAPPAFGENANVNVMRMGEDFVAMTETPLPVSFDPQTLRTLGVGAPAPGQLTVAHPHASPSSGEMVSYATHFGPRTTYRMYTRGRDGEQRVLATLGASRPAYMHSFAITERFAVLVEFPFVVVPLAIPLSGRPFIENYKWHPERGTRFRVVELESGNVHGTYEGDPFFAFHHVNAFERDGELVIDVCAYEDAEIVRGLYLENLRREHPGLPTPELRRCRVSLQSGRVTYERLGDAGIELPRIDYARRNGRPYRFAYGAAQSDRGDFLDQIVKVDTHDGSNSVWEEPGAYPGEPVFVRDPHADAEREDAGVLLSLTLDSQRERSYLLVLDAADLQELARASVPHAIPFGFHGQFMKGTTP
jgi:beta,beta-carotene 9',10'-dioxygenase